MTIEPIPMPKSSKDAVLSLVQLAAAADGSAALSEQALLNLRHDAAGVQHFVVLDGDDVVGYAQAAVDDRGGPVQVEGLVHPEHRRRGVGTALRDVVKATTDGGLLVWAHGSSEGAKAFAASSGARRVRRLLQMRRDIDAATVPGAALPDGVRIRSFEPGRDEDAWLALNSVAFAEHPEQGALTRADLDARMAEPWFDPTGFLLAERDGELVGFHWTKVHPATGSAPAIGEVYVIGVAPAGQGLGMGRALVVAGLAHLASPQATADGPVSEVLLYVEADNEQALALYTGLRFSVAHVDEQYYLD